MTEKSVASKPSSTAEAQAKGLEGVVVGPSAITFLDGLQGRMIYKGYNVLDLAGRTNFEEIVYLLWEKDLPARQPLAEFTKTLAAQRALPPEVIDVLKRLPAKANPMDVLRLAVSHLGILDPEAVVDAPEANRRKAVGLVARMATIAAAWDRIRQGKAPVEPDPSLSHAANFLYMLSGQKPDAISVQALDLYLTLLADHDLNASTFSARVVVSTLSDMYAAITAALGALKGPLHGGANEKAMEMFIEIGDESKTEAYIADAIAQKKKIMGFGHRVYKVEDPRSASLKEMSHRLSELKKDMRWYNISVKVADLVYKSKKINTNVDFYSASVLYLIGIPTDLFTPIFAMSRISGWTAHLFEQLGDNRLIRPVTEYVGPAPRAFRPVDQRG